MGWKMATVKPPEHKFDKKEDKMHFTWSSAVFSALGTFKLHLKGLRKIIPSHELHYTSSSACFRVFQKLFKYIYSFVLLINTREKDT